MHTLLVALTVALSTTASPPPLPRQDANAIIEELKAEIAALKAQNQDGDAFVIQRAAQAVAGVPLDESAMEDAPFAGVRLSDLAPETSAQLPIMPGSGLLIVDVIADGPAAGAGLKAMDVIAKVGDQVVVNADQFRVLVRSRKVGETVTLTVYRGGKELTASFPLGSRKQPKLGPGGRIAGAGFETDGDVMVLSNAPGMQARGMLAPPAKVMTMRGPNGEMTVTVNADANSVGGPAAVVGATAVGAAAGGPGSRTVSKSVYADEHAAITWTTTDGVDSVEITDRDANKVVFQGAGAPDAAALAGLRAEVRASVQRMLEGRAAAESRRPRNAAPLPPAAPARPKPGEASQQAPSAADA